MKKILLSLATIPFLMSPAMAEVGQTNNQDTKVNTSSVNQGVNNQSATGVIEQAPVGGINQNTQINNVGDPAQFGFGPGIYCQGTSLNIGAFGAGNNNNGFGQSSNGGNYGGMINLTIPLDGGANRDCQKLAKEIAHQRVLDTKINMIKQCAVLAKDGIKLDTEVFPEFKICKGVVAAGLGSAIIEPQRVFSAPDTAVPVVPVP